MGVGTSSSIAHEDVVEVLLLLNASRMDALISLSRNRGQTVGQLLRGLIDRELARPEIAFSAS
jgi:hypothetical protein